jgi:Helix-turn-helix domain
MTYLPKQPSTGKAVGGEHERVFRGAFPIRAEWRRVMSKADSRPLEAIREQWQRQIMAAPGRQNAHVIVGIAISWHLNRTTADAWPGFATLAKETGLTERTVIRAVKWLESKGHLHVTHSRGGNIPNRYRPILLSSDLGVTASSDLGVTATETSSDLGVTGALTWEVNSSDSRVIRTSKEPPNNLLESHESKKGEFEKRGKRRKPETPLPDNWTPSIASMDKAKRRSLSDADISRELEKFRNHARQNDRRCRDWDAAADNWMIRAAEFRGQMPHTTNGPAQVIEFKFRPGSAEFEAWRTHYRDTGQNSAVRELDRRREENRPFDFPSQWPPNHAHACVN